MEFLAPLKWIDQKAQLIVDWIAHTILVLFGIRISAQKYVVIAVIIVSMIADYFMIPKKERFLGLLILKLWIAERTLLLQRKMKQIDENCENAGIILNLKHSNAQRIIYFLRIGLVILFAMNFFSVYGNIMRTICNTSWIIFSYLMLTPLTPPRTKQLQEAFSHSS